MDKEFWHNLWENNQIGFHLNEVNELLLKYFDNLNLSKASTIFVPLCGKSLDIPWLLSKGHKVVGIELNEGAIKELFKSMKITPEVSQDNSMIVYKSENITIFVGDIFDLSYEQTGHIDVIYDRAALVALPEQMRVQYTAHILNITKSAPQLLISLEYNQSLRDRAPFSVTKDEISDHYKEHYKISLLYCSDTTVKSKNDFEAIEKVWLLN